MSAKAAAAVNSMIDALASEWQASSRAEFLQLWSARFETKVAEKSADGAWTEFWCSLNRIRLRGLHNVPCLLLGAEPCPEKVVDQFLSRTSAPERIPFILAVTQEAARGSVEAARRSSAVVLDEGTIRSLLVAPDPWSVLRKEVLKWSPLRSLTPYNVLLAPEDNMFFGREGELDRLREQVQTSFAVAGPRRIGKTSLVKKYGRDLGDPWVSGHFYVDLHEWGHKDADGLAHSIAVKVEGTSRSQKVVAATFFDFLRRMRSRLGRRMELALDEVDEVCHGPFFELLGEAAKQGLCRLIVCGLGSLLNAMQDPTSHLFGRLELLRPGPLEETPARALVIEPLQDMGFRIANPDHLVREALRLTGRLPHLLQYFCLKLAEICIDERTETITPRHLDTLRWDYEVAQLFTSPLDKLRSDIRTVATGLLKEPPSRITEATIYHIARESGVKIDFDRAKEITRELFINNVLAWSNGHYRIAFDALVQYANEMGLLQLGRPDAASNGSTKNRPS